MSERATPPIRVLLVDDHPLMRRGIAGVLEDEPDIAIVAEADDGFKAQERYFELLPDVTLMDLAMPRCGGIEAIRAICARDPQACIIAVTPYAGDGQVQRALEAGASGYVLKGSLGAGVADLVRAAHAGRRVLAPDLAQRLTQARPEQLTARARRAGPGRPGPRQPRGRARTGHRRRDGQGLYEQCAAKAPGQRPHACGGDRLAARDAGLRAQACPR